MIIGSGSLFCHRRLNVDLVIFRWDIGFPVTTAATAIIAASVSYRLLIVVSLYSIF